MINENDHAEWIFQNEVTRWFNDEGDLVYRICYDELNKDSIVLDIGGFKGNWASDIYSKYLCNILVFEPIVNYFDYTEKRFKNNNKIRVFNHGFSNIDKIIGVSINSESTSIFKVNDGAVTENITLIDFNTYMNPIKKVGLCKINIEGAEFDILESLNSDNIKKIKNLQIQFHTFIDNCITRRQNIREKLSQTHECTFCYEFVWENWKLKEKNV
jgi:FkbM family methyltransferase